ncbi:MAG TPA: hypothetical protein VGA21_07950 [Cyclobacteriaceae bacterium]|jgi:hypothetical protein
MWYNLLTNKTDASSVTRNHGKSKAVTIRIRVSTGSADESSNQAIFLSSFTDGQNSEKFQYYRPINNLYNPGYSLKKPLYITCQFIGDEFFGFVDELDIYAYGNSEPEVISEIHEDISNILYLLHHPDGELGRKAKKIKKFLSSLVDIK